MMYPGLPVVADLGLILEQVLGISLHYIIAADYPFAIVPVSTEKGRTELQVGDTCKYVANQMLD